VVEFEGLVEGCDFWWGAQVNRVRRSTGNYVISCYTKRFSRNSVVQAGYKS
jgi:hypothetical protein